jgi:hypothetical protein
MIFEPMSLLFTVSLSASDHNKMWRQWSKQSCIERTGDDDGVTIDYRYECDEAPGRAKGMGT